MMMPGAFASGGSGISDPVGTYTQKSVVMIGPTVLPAPKMLAGRRAIPEPKADPPRSPRPRDCGAEWKIEVATNRSPAPPTMLRFNHGPKFADVSPGG